MMSARLSRARDDRAKAEAVGGPGLERSGARSKASHGKEETPWVAVWCPHCSGGYRLPVRWMGRAGARVHCSRCEALFDVPPLEPAAPPGPTPRDSMLGGEREHAESASETIPPALRSRSTSRPKRGRVPKLIQQASAANERIVAREVIENLPWDREDLAEAETQGTLLSRFGPMLLDAFDRYRGRAGPEASTQTFRRAVRDRWGIHIPVSVGRE